MYLGKSRNAEINGLISRLVKHNRPVKAFIQQKADEVKIIVCICYTLRTVEDYWNNRNFRH